MTKHRLFPLVAEDVNYGHIAQEEVSNLWHKRYGHVNSYTLKHLYEKKLVRGLFPITTVDPCEACSLGKQTRNEFPKGVATCARAPLELVHGDVVGPMKTPTTRGNLYFMLLTDDCSRYSWPYFLKIKSQALQHFKMFKSFVKKHQSLPLKALWTDREESSCP